MVSNRLLKPSCHLTPPNILGQPPLNPKANPPNPPYQGGFKANPPNPPYQGGFQTNPPCPPCQGGEGRGLVRGLRIWGFLVLCRWRGGGGWISLVVLAQCLLADRGVGAEEKKLEAGLGVAMLLAGARASWWMLRELVLFSVNGVVVGFAVFPVDFVVLGFFDAAPCIEF